MRPTSSKISRKVLQFVSRIPPRRVFSTQCPTGRTNHVVIVEVPGDVELVAPSALQRFQRSITNHKCSVGPSEVVSLSVGKDAANIAQFSYCVARTNRWYQDCRPDHFKRSARQYLDIPDIGHVGTGTIRCFTDCPVEALAKRCYTVGTTIARRENDRAMDDAIVNPPGDRALKSMVKAKPTTTLSLLIPMASPSL